MGSIFLFNQSTEVVMRGEKRDSSVVSGKDLNSVEDT